MFFGICHGYLFRVHCCFFSNLGIIYCLCLVFIDFNSKKINMFNILLCWSACFYCKCLFINEGDTPVFRCDKKICDTSCSIFCVEWRRWIYPESLSHFRRMSCVTRWPSVRCTSVRWSRLPDNTPCPGKSTTPVKLLYSSM